MEIFGRVRVESGSSTDGQRIFCWSVQEENGKIFTKKVKASARVPSKYDIVMITNQEKKQVVALANGRVLFAWRKTSGENDKTG